MEKTGRGYCLFPPCLRISSSRFSSHGNCMPLTLLQNLEVKISIEKEAFENCRGGGGESGFRDPSSLFLPPQVRGALAGRRNRPPSFLQLLQQLPGDQSACPQLLVRRTAEELKVRAGKGGCAQEQEGRGGSGFRPRMLWLLPSRPSSG